MYYFIYLSYFTDSYTIIYLYNSIYCKYVGIIIVFISLLYSLFKFIFKV